MKVEYKSMFLGVALGVVGVFTFLFLLGDVKTEFSVKTGEELEKLFKEHGINKNDSNINIDMKINSL